MAGVQFRERKLQSLSLIKDIVYLQIRKTGQFQGSSPPLITIHKSCCALHCIPTALRQIPFQLLPLLNKARRDCISELQEGIGSSRHELLQHTSHISGWPKTNMPLTLLFWKQKLKQPGLRGGHRTYFCFQDLLVAFAPASQWNWMLNEILYLNIEVICQVSSNFILKIRHRSISILQG